MWLFLFGTGALLLHRTDLPAGWGSALPHPPPAWAPYALYFLVVALLRLAIRDARLRPLQKKAKALASEPSTPIGAADFGMGVGKGVAAVVVGGDFLGAAMAWTDLLVRWLLGSRAKGKRRVPAAIREAIARERKSALACIGVVGGLCLAQAVEPDLLARATADALALAGIGL